MRSLVGKPPVHMPEYRFADYDCLNVKLKTYYARKRKLYEDTYPDFYDADLRQLFAAPAGIKASVYLQRRRRRLLNAICQWTNENKFRVNQLLARLTRRCDQLGLHVLNDDPQQDFRVSAFITTLVMNYLFTGKFRNNPGFDQNIVSFFEMQGLPFTGCGSTGLTLCKHKGISKKILHYHGIHVPHFVVIPRGQRIARRKQLRFPILVKPVKEEASYGISQASFVDTDEQFRERVAFIHEKYNSDAIAEEYIDGRELYVSLMGNVRLTVL